MAEYWRIAEKDWPVARRGRRHQAAAPIRLTLILVERDDLRLGRCAMTVDLAQVPSDRSLDRAVAVMVWMPQSRRICPDYESACGISSYIGLIAYQSGIEDFRRVFIPTEHQFAVRRILRS
jgi:hypothetical protein